MLYVERCRLRRRRSQLHPARSSSSSTRRVRAWIHSISHRRSGPANSKSGLPTRRPNNSSPTGSAGCRRSMSSRRSSPGCARSLIRSRKVGSPTSCCSAWVARASRRKSYVRYSAPPIDCPAFEYLDSVDPDAVRAAMVRARDTLFVLASKSGSTIEPNVMAKEAERRVIAEGHAHWGTRFVAITDPDTALHRRATAEGFRDVFLNPSDIGGRYSALSLFGMVPAALMGLDLDELLAGGRAMEQACRLDQPRRESRPRPRRLDGRSGSRWS